MLRQVLDGDGARYAALWNAESLVALSCDLVGTRHLKKACFTTRLTACHTCQGGYLFQK